MAKPYSVNLWGSCPDLDNDDCWTGYDFETLEDARAAFEHPETVDVDWFQRDLADRATVYIELIGPDVVKHRRLRPDRKPERDDDWRREMAMEAGMLHGVGAYNEVMGWDVESDG